MTLPPCAWAVELQDGQPRVFRGSRTERLGAFIFEGAWAGDYSLGGALSSPFRCGSGAVISGRKLRLLSPSHCIDPVYCYTSRDFSRVVASNSVHFLVALAPEATPKGVLRQARTRAATLKRGVHGYDKLLWKTAAGYVHQFAWNGATVDLDRRQVKEDVATASPPPFDSYASYRAYLSATVQAVSTTRAIGDAAPPSIGW